MLDAHKFRALSGGLAEFYAEGLTASTYVERGFALTSRVVDCCLNSHGEIDRRTGALSARFDWVPPGLEKAFAAFGRHMSKYAPFRFDPSLNQGRPFSARDFFQPAEVPRSRYLSGRLSSHGL